jgi:hypothetical protein
VRLGSRTGTVQAIRKGPGTFLTDVKIRFDGEEKPIWFIYSSLQSSKERGDLTVLDAGPPPGFLARLLDR